LLHVSDIAALYKILKYDTNQKILKLINENGSLSYTDLMEKSEFYTEALLNHHINVLSEFLSKNEEYRYVLTERGQLALKLLEENPEQIKKFERKKQKQNGVYAGLGYVITLIFTLIFWLCLIIG
jgi:predicted house-cleaning noncanonical NTP pyrophosphatase (MazG superfamily)